MPATKTGKGKGTYFVALREFVKKHHGEDSWQALLQAMPEEDRETLDTAVSIAWIDMEVRIHSLHALVKALGESHPEVLTEFGRFEAERDLSTTQRVFLRMANPGWTLKKAGQYWRRYYDWGELRVTRQDKKHTSAEIVDSVVTDALYCQQFMAYMCRVFELCGAKEVSVEHTRCRARGDETCLFEGSWK